MSTVCADLRPDVVAVASFAALQRFGVVRRGRSVEIDQGSSSATDHPAVIAQAMKPVRPALAGCTAREFHMADLLTLKKFEALSPFEIKDELIKLAKKTSRTSQSAFLNAGRGNPNWVATTPREGYFLLGQFAITESKRVMEHPAGLGGMPQAQGIAGRLETWLAKHDDMPGAGFLSSMVPFALKTFGFQPDAFVHELVDSIIGDNYP